MKSVDADLAAFASEAKPKPVRKPRTGHASEAKPKPVRKPRTGHASPFETGLPPPGEEVPPPIEEPPPRRAAPHVYAAICEVMAGLSQTGIGKDRDNLQQKYKFRSIDDVYNALSALLVKHHLVILPHVDERSVTERATKDRSGVLNYVNIKMTFTLVSAVDGSREQVSSYGEAMDWGDKATNKALSTAYKYMAMQTFCIPTIGIDPEEDTYDDKQDTPPPPPPGKPAYPSPNHVETLVQLFLEKTAGNRDEATRWWHTLEPEDQEILKVRFPKPAKQEARH